MTNETTETANESNDYIEPDYQVSDTDEEETEAVETDEEDVEASADDEEDGGADDGDIEVEEIEIEAEGGKYKVPKPLGDLIEAGKTFLTDKEQIAQARAEHDAQVKQFSETSQLQYEQIESVAQLHALDSQIAEFNRVDWIALSNADPQQAQQLFMQAQQLKDSRGQLVGQIEQQRQQLIDQKQRESAERIAKSDTVLSKEIKGWSPAKETALIDYAVKSFGFSAEDVKSAKADPRVFLLLNAAHIGHQAQLKEAGKVKQLKPNIKPVTKLSKGKGSSPKDLDNMTPAEWRDYRMKQQQSKLKRG